MLFKMFTVSAVAFLVAQKICERSYPAAYEKIAVYFELNKLFGPATNPYSDIPTDDCGCAVTDEVKISNAALSNKKVHKQFANPDPNVNSTFRNIYFAFTWIWVTSGLSFALNAIISLFNFIKSLDVSKFKIL
jgi:hypothetical protein